MASRFTTILVPVDFTINTEVAIVKALELCEGKAAAIHLYYVQKIIYPSVAHFFQYRLAGYSIGEMIAQKELAARELLKWQHYIHAARPDVESFSWVGYGQPVQEAIAEKARKLQANLVIIGKNSHHSWFPFLNTVVPSKLAASTGIPVLTVKPGALNNSIRTIVVPVGNRFPKRKLEVLEALRRKSRFHIRLVTFADNNTGAFYKEAFLDTYRMIKNNLTGEVDYEVLNGTNKARSLLRYCNKVGADILLVHPESETRIGWWNKHISDVLPVNSRTQVLAVHAL